MVNKIEVEPGEDAVELNFTFKGKVDIRTFREDANFILDVSKGGVAASTAPAAGAAPAGELPGLSLVPPDDKGAPPSTIPVLPAPPAASDKAAPAGPSPP